MTQTTGSPIRRYVAVTSIAAVVAVTFGATVSYPLWSPLVGAYVAPTNVSDDAGAEDECVDGHDHSLNEGHTIDDGHNHSPDDGHDHSADKGESHPLDDGHNHAADTGQDDVHEGHDEANSLQLNQASWKNIGLKTAVVAPQTYVKTVSVPAMVVERPGRSQVGITAPLTGTVTRVAPIEGESVGPDEPLFDLRLTHEDLVTAQRDFLRSAQELDVVKREIDRLQSAGEGAIAGRRVLEQQYEQQKIEAALHAQRQGLLLHGLNESQIDDIIATRRLLQTLTVTTPPFPTDGDHHESQHLFHVQEILVKPGDHVTAGDSLAVLADHCLLYVEGQAFEDDAPRLLQASRDSRLFDVSSTTDGKAPDEKLQLQVLYVADNIDPESRALRFYLQLPNHLIRDQQQSGHRFVAWKYRPGQRMKVNIPLGQAWKDQIVLPPEAVVQEGTDAFVFEQNGDHFDRVHVHVVYRDGDAVVVENDGSLIGSTLATAGAYQMHLAIKNKVGGGIDPHAGHGH